MGIRQYIGRIGDKISSTYKKGKMLAAGTALGLSLLLSSADKKNDAYAGELGEHSPGYTQTLRDSFGRTNKTEVKFGGTATDHYDVRNFSARLNFDIAKTLGFDVKYSMNDGTFESSRGAPDLEREIERLTIGLPVYLSERVTVVPRFFRENEEMEDQIQLDSRRTGGGVDFIYDGDEFDIIATFRSLNGNYDATTRSGASGSYGYDNLFFGLKATKQLQEELLLRLGFSINERNYDRLDQETITKVWGSLQYQTSPNFRIEPRIGIRHEDDGPGESNTFGYVDLSATWQAKPWLQIIPSLGVDAERGFTAGIQARIPLGKIFSTSKKNDDVRDRRPRNVPHNKHHRNRSR